MTKLQNGVLPVDKPAGWTSFDVLAKLRGALGTRRLGHTGTLDPMVTGVLVVLIGPATAAADRQPDQDKTYEGTLRLGLATDTGDLTGTVLRTAPVTAGERELLAVLPRFVGNIRQLPPMYSAVKVNGQPLYKAARQGKTVERTPRPVTIHAIDYLGSPAPGDFTLRVRCSKGTYIRTLCHDIGQLLGCGGAMYSLRRTMAAGFTLDQAVTLEEVQARGEALLLPTDSLFAEHPVLRLPAGTAERRVRCGNPVSLPGTRDGVYRVYSQEGQFLCLSRASGGTLTSIKNFFGA